MNNYEELSKEQTNKFLFYLRKFSLNITEVADLLQLPYKKAQELTRFVRSKFKKEYNYLYGLNSVNPKHLMLTVGWTEEHFLEFVSNK